MGAGICIEGAYKTYKVGDQAYPALRGLSIAIDAGEFVGITGRSGSGKTTLLNIMGGMDSIDRGSIVVGDVDLRNLDEDRLARWRGRTIGVVFQFFQLLPTLTVMENVELCLELSGQGETSRERRERSAQVLARVGLTGLEQKFPAQLSGGQQQRCAIARAIAHRPGLILADEPTGNLDSQTAEEIIALLRELHAGGATVIIVTHDRDISNVVDREIGIVDGIVAFDCVRPGETLSIGARS